MTEIKTYDVKQKPKNFLLINIVLGAINLGLFVGLAVLLFSPDNNFKVVIGKYGIFTILFGMWIIVLGYVIARRRKQNKVARAKQWVTKLKIINLGKTNRTLQWCLLVFLKNFLIGLERIRLIWPSCWLIVLRDWREGMGNENE